MRGSIGRSGRAICWVLAILVAPGCAMFERIFSPSAPPATPTAPPVMEAPAPAPAAPSIPEPAPTPPTPPPPPPAAPAPPSPAPSPPPSPPARTPAPAVRPPATTPSPVAPVPTAPAPAPAPPPVLTPQVGKADEDRLRRESEARIEKVEQLLAAFDQRRLGNEDRETQATVKDFVAKAKEALASQDLLRASSLSEKAQVLANDLASRVK
jgi:hypothetical protein